MSTPDSDGRQDDRAERARAGLKRANRALAFLSGSNRTLLRATDAETLLNDICRLATTTGGYRLAWVGQAEDTAEKWVRPIAQSGFAHDYLDHIRVTWGDDPLGQGPVGSAIRGNRPCLIRHMQADDHTAPWHAMATRYDLHSSLALPLQVDGRVFGTLTLYATQDDAFDTEELALLEEVSLDLAFGLDMLRLRRARDEAEAALRRQAHSDFVTGLGNRACLTDRLQAELDQGGQGHILFLDLDHFREINDSQGYLVGDLLLKAVAARLTAAVPRPEHLARIGGDEFTLLLPGADADAARAQAARLSRAMIAPFPLAEGMLSLRMKVGITSHPGGRAGPDEILADAGLASRQAHPATDMVQLYHPGMSAALNERMDLSQRLKTAMALGGLALHYQPKVDMRQGRLHSAEALLRWHDPALGHVGPDRFIPIAEERGLMPDLGLWVLQEACRQKALWKQAGLTFPGRLAVNVSASQFAMPDFFRLLPHIVEINGCTPQDFELEITESILLVGNHGVMDQVGHLRDLGFAFAIDDFGTGYSSLSYLTRLKAETLKIDISFVRNMLRSPEDHILIKTIIGMANSLGLATVAEGVETEHHVHELLRLGCHVAQGFHYGRAEPAEEFSRRWLRD